MSMTAPTLCRHRREHPRHPRVAAASQAYSEGRIKHVRFAIALAMGTESWIAPSPFPTCEPSPGVRSKPRRTISM